MITVQSTFRAMSPLQHGGDDTNSNVRLFRRRQVALKNPSVIASAFQNEEERKRAAISILDIVYDSIDLKRKQKNYGAWDEFTSKIRSCAQSSSTQQEWFSKMCGQFGVEAVSNYAGIAMLDRFHAQEFCELMLNQAQYLVAYQRLLREKRKEGAQAGNELFATADTAEPTPNLVFKKTHENIPYIAGNAIRGALRRLLMLDYTNRIGITNDRITGAGVKIPYDFYHQLFTGGNITESTAFEDIGQRNKYLAMIPPIGLIGSAIGNGTIQGAAITGDADLCCLENGMGEQSYARFLTQEFGTRLDSLKFQHDVGVENAEGEPPTTQMIYYQEVVMQGAEFTFFARLVDEQSPVLTSVFWHGLDLLKKSEFIGGKSATGHGRVEYNFDIPEGASQPYIDYLEANKEAMRTFVTQPVLMKEKAAKGKKPAQQSELEEA